MRLLLENVTIARDGIDRLGPVSLCHDLSGITCVLGHNGAGKSLFLRTVHGLIDPDAGRVTWDGAAAFETRRRRGFMFQTPPVMRRSVADNVAFPLLAAEVGASERRQRVASALEDAGLTALARQPAATLSGGEKQRMALARALVIAPEVMLLDEPCANLDPAATRLLEATLRRVTADGVQVLMSTHDIAQARRLADHVLLFAAGAVVFSGPANRFFDQTDIADVENFKRGYI